MSVSVPEYRREAVTMAVVILISVGLIHPRIETIMVRIVMLRESVAQHLSTVEHKNAKD
jgi:hypothetical protein